MNSVALVRPGFRMGIRPERRVPEDMDKIDLAWSRRFSHRLSPELKSFQGFAFYLREIESAESRYLQLDLAKRKSLLHELRASLRSDTSTFRDVANAFAMIRSGMQQTLGIRLFDEQLYAGWCLYEGHFAEMQTGEGKTLTAALPAIAMAMAGVPVHVVTSNEYLAQRDAQTLEPLYAWFGLQSGVVLSHQDDDQRRNGYACDIAYCAHQQLVFDYLRDTRLLGNQRQGLSAQIHELLQDDVPATLQRGLCFAIVDEADSVLIDDARTPLILAEPVGVDDGAIAEAAVALAIARTLVVNDDFTVHEKDRQVSLFESGVASIVQQTLQLAGVWKLPRYRDERIVQALTALYLYEKDNDYAVIDDAVVLIDQSTGRPMPQRRLQHGLHRMIEVKERCSVSDETAAVSSLSFQSFFTRYHRLCGMSGTLRESRNELRRVYGPHTVSIPTVKTCQRLWQSRTVHSNREAQLIAVIEQVEQCRARGRAILIGTRTVSLSEKVSDALSQSGIRHTVLNARQDSDEAAIIANAGEAGRVTVATNMAGRGTDIRCSASVIQSGGLHVLNLEINDAARIDRQLHGRAARQGEPGSCQDMFCLDDEVLRRELGFSGLRLLSWSIERPQSRFSLAVTGLVLRYAQRTVEARFRRLRIAVRDGQTQLQKMLAIGGYAE